MDSALKIEHCFFCRVLIPEEKIRICVRGSGMEALHGEADVTIVFRSHEWYFGPGADLITILIFR